MFVEHLYTMPQPEKFGLLCWYPHKSIKDNRLDYRKSPFDICTFFDVPKCTALDSNQGPTGYEPGVLTN